MKLFDDYLDVDKELKNIIEYDDSIPEYCDYLIMSKSTFIVFSELSKNIDKKKMIWGE